MSSTEYTVDVTVTESNTPIDVSVYSDEAVSTNTRDVVGSTETDHRLLTHRDSPDQHPMAAITGLNTTLQNMSAAIDSRLTADENGIIMLQVDVGGVTQRIGVVEGDVVDAATTATNYLTPVSATGGIRLHTDDSSLLSYVTLDTNGLDITDSGTSIASFGATTRLGSEGDNHITLDSSGMVVSDGTHTLASFGEETLIGQYAANNTRLTLGADGMTIKRIQQYSNYLVANPIAQIGYGSVISSGSTTQGSWYSLGSRDTSTTGGSIGLYSFVAGDNNVASETASMALGYWVHATQRFQTVIGAYNADSSNRFVIGNGTSYNNRSNAFEVSSSGTVYVNGSTVHSSDRRLKEHIDYLGDEAVDFINGLKPAHYTKDGKSHVGFYAQDVAEVDKWDCMIGKEMNGYMTLGYMELIAPLVAYVQKLEKRIEELERSK